MGRDDILCRRGDLIFAYPLERLDGDHLVPIEGAKATPFILNSDGNKMKNLLTGEIYELNADFFDRLEPKQAQKPQAQKPKSSEELSDRKPIIEAILGQLYSCFDFVTYESPRGVGLRGQKFDFDCYYTDRAGNAACITFPVGWARPLERWVIEDLCKKNNGILGHARWGYFYDKEEKEKERAAKNAIKF